MLNGVVFDFNGTLFFDSKYHFEVFNQLKLEIAGEPLTMKEMESTYAGKPNVEIFKMMSGGRLNRQQCEQLSIRKEAMYRQLVKESGVATLCDGAIEVFELLKKNHIPFTIASASIKENIDFFVDVFHLDNWFDPSQIIYDDGSYKDKIDMFKNAFKVLGVNNNTLIYEDSLSGIQCGSQVADYLIIIYSESLQDEYTKYPKIITTVSNLKESISSLHKLIQ